MCLLKEITLNKTLQFPKACYEAVYGQKLWRWLIDAMRKQEKQQLSEELAVT